LTFDQVVLERYFAHTIKGLFSKFKIYFIYIVSLMNWHTIVLIAFKSKNIRFKKSIAAFFNTIVNQLLSLTTVIFKNVTISIGK
jgi:hypothetical protein